MKKTADQKQVSVKNEKIQNAKKAFSDLPEFQIPFDLIFMPNFPAAFNHRFFSGKNNNGNKSH